MRRSDGLMGIKAFNDYVFSALSPGFARSLIWGEY